MFKETMCPDEKHSYTLFESIAMLILPGVCASISGACWVYLGSFGSDPGPVWARNFALKHVHFFALKLGFVCMLGHVELMLGLY
jgi:hypothetical protein